MRIEAKATLCHDPFIQDPSFVALDKLVAESDILIVATPHREYAELRVPADKAVVDIWNCLPSGDAGA